MAKQAQRNYRHLIKELSQLGKSIEAIATALAISTSTVSKWRSRIKKM